MSRSLHAWINMRKERRKISRNFTALAHYLRARMPICSDYGVLMHIMMRCDFQAYYYLGKCITGVAWVKGRDGVPIPVFTRKIKEVERLKSKIRGATPRTYIVDDPLAMDEPSEPSTRDS